MKDDGIMKKMITQYCGIFILLIGVLILCLHGFGLTFSSGNLQLIAGCLFIVAGFLVYIIMNKKNG